MSVCLSVCVREIWHYRHQAGIRAIPTASARQARENVRVASAKSTPFDLGSEAARVERLDAGPSPLIIAVRACALYVRAYYVAQANAT